MDSERDGPRVSARRRGKLLYIIPHFALSVNRNEKIRQNFRERRADDPAAGIVIRCRVVLLFVDIPLVFQLVGFAVDPAEPVHHKASAQKIDQGDRVSQSEGVSDADHDIGNAEDP